MYGLVPTLPILILVVCSATALVIAQVLRMKVSWGNQTKSKPACSASTLKCTVSRAVPT